MKAAEPGIAARQLIRDKEDAERKLIDNKKAEEEAKMDAVWEAKKKAATEAKRAAEAKHAMTLKESAQRNDASMTLTISTVTDKFELVGSPGWTISDLKDVLCQEIGKRKVELLLIADSGESLEDAQTLATLGKNSFVVSVRDVLVVTVNVRPGKPNYWVAAEPKILEIAFEKASTVEDLKEAVFLQFYDRKEMSPPFDRFNCMGNPQKVDLAGYERRSLFFAPDFGEYSDQPKLLVDLPNTEFDVKFCTLCTCWPDIGGGNGNFACGNCGGTGYCTKDEAKKPKFTEFKKTMRPLKYAWDQTDAEVKVYVEFDQTVELTSGVTEEHVSVEFGEWNLQILITDPTGMATDPFGLQLADFQQRIDPDHSKYVLRSKRLTIKLRKLEIGQNWPKLLQPKAVEKKQKGCAPG